MSTETDSLPSKGRLVGVDYGTVRIGLAICDPGQKFASPLDVYQRRNLRLDQQYFQQLTANERLVGFVVGLPIHNSGDESEKSREAREFSAWLQQHCQVPVVMYDERFTTAQARELLNESRMSGRKRKERLDKIAAQILLATYLESPAQAVPWKRQAEVDLTSLEDPDQPSSASTE